MKLKLNTKNLELESSVLKQVKGKFTKLERYLPETVEVRVEMTEEKTHSPIERFTVQITIEMGGIILRGEENGDTLLNAVDRVAEIIIRQIKRYRSKKRRSNRSNDVARAIKSGELPTATPPEVKLKKFIIYSMTLKEAIEQMDLLGHDFFLYLSNKDDGLRLLYRRHAGGYGLIEPKAEEY